MLLRHAAVLVLLAAPDAGCAATSDEPERADESAARLCAAEHQSSTPFDMTSAGDDGQAWLAAGGEVNVSQEVVIRSFEVRGVSLELSPSLRTLDLRQVPLRSLPLAVGDRAWLEARSLGGATFEPVAWYVVLRASADGPALLAAYQGDERLLARFASALDLEIAVGDACSYAPEQTCFDGQRVSVLDLTLSGDDTLTVASGESGTLTNGAEAYAVVVSSAVRWDEGISTRCADGIFGASIALHMLAQ